ncbi:MAG: Maf family protein [Acidobacteriota bacterium]|nr:Maf family protein [Acidobacteriota bacterium]
MLTEKLLLASGSPRRAEILRAVGWPFETMATDIDETFLEGESAESEVKRLALAKAEAAGARRETRALVLGADTTVVVDSEILAKPEDDEDARRMLRLLSGRWHEVLTGVALVRAGEDGRRAVAYERTRVRFGKMSDEEIDWYVRSDEPMDKAGGYAVQGRAALFIEEIRGDYWNVIGLPIRLVYRMVKKMMNAE